MPWYYVLDGEVAYSAVDTKPKSTLALRRLDNLEAHRHACPLVEIYDGDWTEIWWIRLDCDGRVLADGDERERALALLAAKYPQCRSTRPPAPLSP